MSNKLTYQEGKEEHPQYYTNELIDIENKCPASQLVKAMRIKLKM